MSYKEEVPYKEGGETLKQAQKGGRSPVSGNILRLDGSLVKLMSLKISLITAGGFGLDNL